MLTPKPPNTQAAVPLRFSVDLLLTAMAVEKADTVTETTAGRTVPAAQAAAADVDPPNKTRTTLQRRVVLCVFDKFEVVTGTLKADSHGIRV